MSSVQSSSPPESPRLVLDEGDEDDEDDEDLFLAALQEPAASPSNELVAFEPAELALTEVDSNKRSALVLGDEADEQPTKKVAVEDELAHTFNKRNAMVLDSGNEVDEQPRKRANTGKSAKERSNEKPIMKKKAKKPASSPLSLPISLLMEGDLSVWEESMDEEINFDLNWNKRILPNPDEEGL